MKAFKELRAFWEKCRDARDNLDQYYEETGKYHVDCCCPDCKVCRDYFDHLPFWKFRLAQVLWGEP